MGREQYEPRVAVPTFIPEPPPTNLKGSILGHHPKYTLQTDMNAISQSNQGIQYRRHPQDLQPLVVIESRELPSVVRFDPQEAILTHTPENLVPCDSLGASSAPYSPLSPTPTAFDSSRVIVTHLNPTTSGNTRRYLPPTELKRVDHTSICAAVILSPSRTQPDRGGWVRHVHPEGKPYFYDPTKRIPTVTDNNLFDNVTLDKIEAAYQLVFERMQSSSINFDSLPHLELLLELDPYDDESCDYFFIDHDSCCVFWLDDSVTTESLNLHPVSSPEHLKLQLLREYWIHVEHFPNHITLDPSAEAKLLETLAWSSLDHMTCETSTSAYPASKIERFISTLKHCPDGMKTWTIARISALFVGHQFFNYHGLVGARLERTTSVEDNSTHASPDLLMKTLFIFLLNAPRTHLDKLDKLWVDQVLYAEQWEKFVTDLLRDWNEISLLATVLLAGNMAFLAIAASQPYPTAASMASTILALGSIITSLVNGRQQRSRLSPLAMQAGAFLERTCHPTLGLQLLAVFFALPYALMLWSVVTFAGAILIQSFGTVGTLSITMISTVAALVAIVIIVTVAFVWLDDRQWECGSAVSWFSWSGSPRISFLSSKGRDYDIEGQVQYIHEKPLVIEGHSIV